MEYVLTDGTSVTGKGMRFEALGRWPGMRTCVGMNMDQGHAIRLRASYVNTASHSSLLGTIVHELAHTEQWAEGRHILDNDECERDVEARLRAWGLEEGCTEFDRQALLDSMDQIIKYAEKLKRTIKKQEHLPSGSFATAAFSEAERVLKVMTRLADRWRGRA
jgi:hypothetical protein